MKSLFTFASMFFCLLMMQAQSGSYDIDWGPTYKSDGGRYSYSWILGGDDKYFYEISRPKKDNEIKKYDFKGNLVSTTPINLKVGKQNVSPSRIFHLRGGDYLYFSLYDKKTKLRTLYTAEFNSGKVGDILPLHKYDLSEYERSGATQVLISKDSSHIAFFKSVAQNKKDDERLKIVVFDSDLQKKWSRTYDLKEPNRKINVQQYKLTNDGKLIATAKVYKDADEREKGIPVYDFKLFVIGKEESSSYPIFDGHNIVPTETGLFEGEPNEVFIGGFFTEKEKGTGENGVIFVKVNTSTGEVLDRFHEFEPQFLSGLVRGRKIEKGQGLSSNYNIDHFFSYKNGTFSFVAEYYKVTTTQRMVTNSDGSTSWVTTYVYHSNQLILPKFNREGDLISLEKIDKKFSSKSSIITSYTFAKHDNKTYFLYNDHKSGDEKDEMDVKGKDRRRNLFTDLLVMDENGEIEYRETLFTNNDMETVFIPRKSQQIGDKMVIGGKRKKEYQYGIIHLH